ncbi:ferritin-like domain-containing protein [Novosphingobium sp.]|uniref:YciE/YciF ferroxidase family protein n=1 Tax=Novosphingobium sp. TaxID=1874826 RepID=UPI003D11CE63
MDFVDFLCASWRHSRQPGVGLMRHRATDLRMTALSAHIPWREIMSEITTLQELYVDELKDLWSANDQMAKALKKIVKHATDEKLTDLLEKSQEGIAAHTDILKQLIENQDAKVKKEHCKGMEGLVAEALKHSVDEAPEKGPVRDAAIIAQFQRMTHYGITGFGTVAAFAKALELDDDSTKLETAVKDMHRGDDLMSELAQSAVNVAASDI